MNLSRHTRRARLGILSAAALAALTVIPAQAREEAVAAKAATSATFLNGGVGQRDEDYMHRIAKDWPLRMTFSERKDNEFAADVNVLVTDKQGKRYLQLDRGGPMTYAMLPPGTYRITARFHGQPETREVTLDGKNGRDVYFHWKGSAKSDPFDGKPLGGEQRPG